MQKSANIMTRVEPDVKEQAELVLAQLGISMSTAMSMYLRQIAMQKKIPFEMALPSAKPVALGSLSDEQLHGLMETALLDYEEGRYTSFDDFKNELKKEIGLRPNGNSF